MLLETLLSYLHIVAIFSLIVFQASQAALLRAEWFNAAALQRLQRLALIAKVASALVIVSGLARLFMGIKPWGLYLQNPLMHLKLTLVVLMIALAIPAGLAYKRWAAQYARNSQLPAPADIQKARRWVMLSSHLMLIIPLAAVFIARGYGWK